jgi:hypothetical protein
MLLLLFGNEMETEGMLRLEGWTFQEVVEITRRFERLFIFFLERRRKKKMYI